MREIGPTIRRNAMLWLSQGISPRSLALTLALGFAIGCIPLIGIPTLLCATLALALRLNQPAIQAANYLAMPLQLALIVPFVRLGGWIVSAKPARALSPSALLHLPSWNLVEHMGGMAGQALLAWLFVAVPAVLFLTATLTLMLQRIPAMQAAEAGD